MHSPSAVGSALTTFGAVIAQAAGSPPITRWLIVGALAVIAIYLLMAAVRCALRIVGLVVLVAVAWLAWRWFS